MAPADLTEDELCDLVRTVFDPKPGRDRALAVLCDVPRSPDSDRAAWRERRAIAVAWARTLASRRAALGLETVDLLVYPDVGSNNADLPVNLLRVPADVRARADLTLERLPEGCERVPTETALGEAQILLAPTEYSTTAPLKVLARRLRFRAATLPGFSRSMLPALRLDTAAVSRRVLAMKERLDAAESAQLELEASGAVHALTLDLRHRSAHASDGLIREPGMAANLPSGEAYIVPYEGERAGDSSRSAGTLAVEMRDEVVLFRIERNRVAEVVSRGPESRREAEALREEPACGNIAELGLGILGDFGITAVGSVLLDEKLGLHVAFGRSDHFGGMVGPKDFRDPSRVIHLDHVYVPSLQPAVHVRRVALRFPGGGEEDVMRDGRYVV
jgi:hypothetical protein